jgi:hypothetical protein
VGDCDFTPRANMQRIHPREFHPQHFKVQTLPRHRITLNRGNEILRTTYLFSVPSLRLFLKLAVECYIEVLTVNLKAVPSYLISVTNNLSIFYILLSSISISIYILLSYGRATP